MSKPKRSINLTGLKLPNIKLDPSAIKDRWGLAAFGLIIWLLVAYFCLSNKSANIWIMLSVLGLTTIIIPVILSITKSDAPVKTHRARASGTYILPEDKTRPVKIGVVIEAMTVLKYPGIEEMIEALIEQGEVEIE